MNNYDDKVKVSSELREDDFTKFAKLLKLSTPEQVRRAMELASEQSHPVIAPSHVVYKGTEQAGYFTVANIPVWFGHLSPKLITPKDTFRLIRSVEDRILDTGTHAILTFVSKESPLHKKMSELGYMNTGNADVFVKEVK